MKKAQHEKQKESLEKEKQEVEEILSAIGERVGKTDHFNPKVADFGDDVTEYEDEEADEAEEFSRRIGITEVLSKRLQDIDDALKKIKEGAYGTCENCEKEISAKTLDADPASRLCLSCKHAD